MVVSPRFSVGNGANNSRQPRRGGADREISYPHNVDAMALAAKALRQGPPVPGC
jgi:hypothetical protein